MTCFICSFPSHPLKLDICQHMFCLPSSVYVANKWLLKFADKKLLQSTILNEKSYDELGQRLPPITLDPGEIEA